MCSDLLDRSWLRQLWQTLPRMYLSFETLPQCPNSSLTFKLCWPDHGTTQEHLKIETYHSYLLNAIHMSNGLNLLHPRKDVAEMVIVFCVSLIVPEDLMFAIKSGEHVYQESSFFVSPLSFLRVSWWYQVSMSWCNCSKMSEVLAGAHMLFNAIHMLFRAVMNSHHSQLKDVHTSLALGRAKPGKGDTVDLPWDLPFCLGTAARWEIFQAPAGLANLALSLP